MITMLLWVAYVDERYTRLETSTQSRRGEGNHIRMLAVIWGYMMDSHASLHGHKSPGHDVDRRTILISRAYPYASQFKSNISTIQYICSTSDLFPQTITPNMGLMTDGQTDVHKSSDKREMCALARHVPYFQPHKTCNTLLVWCPELSHRGSWCPSEWMCSRELQCWCQTSGLASFHPGCQHFPAEKGKLSIHWSQWADLFRVY